MTDSKIANSFIPRERVPLPRILLLDFAECYKDFLESENYSVYLGSSGLSGKPPDIPIHESEVEIIFWDASNLQGNLEELSETLVMCPYRFKGTSDEIAIANDAKNIKTYFEKIKRKGGFLGAFLGNVNPAILSPAIGSDYYFKERKTSTMRLNKYKEDDAWYEFYKRFIKEENIKFSIHSFGRSHRLSAEFRSADESVDENVESDNFVYYFHDENYNNFAVIYGYFAIIPQIEDNRKEETLIFLLQDVLPYFCKGSEIFPDKYYFRWANKDFYLPSKVQKLRKNEKEIIEQHQQQLEQIKNETKQAMNEAEYLSNMLIADDSDSFPDDKKLSVSVQIVLQNDLGFKVTNVDEMRLNAGKSLKEDIWVKDNDGFFALGEIKGTDKGAKASWIKLDLNAHIKEFEVLKGITGLNSILIFNHERRTEPEDRNRPFLGDSDLIEYCIRSNICLLPVYELFKLARDVKEGLVSAKEARDKIKICKGLFNY